MQLLKVILYVRNIMVCVHVFRAMMIFVLGTYIIEKISVYLSIKDLSHLELSCKTLCDQLEEAGAWRSKFQLLSRIYKYGFIANIGEYFSPLVDHDSGCGYFYKVLTGLVVLTHRGFKNHFQCCYWEQKHIDELASGSKDCRSEELVEVDEICLEEFIFTKGDTIVFRKDHFVVVDLNFPDLGLRNPLKIIPNDDMSNFLSSYKSWLEEYLIFIEKYFDVLREQVFLAH